MKTAQQANQAQQGTTTRNHPMTAIKVIETQNGRTEIAKQGNTVTVTVYDLNGKAYPSKVFDEETQKYELRAYILQTI